MTVKNYLVTAIRPISSGTLNYKDPELYLEYKKMWKMSLASYKKFIQESFEVVVWDDPVPDVDTHCTENWYAIKELWHKEPCNILWAGADTLMIQPTSIFNARFSEFRMFNTTDPKEVPEFSTYLNDDIRWYPHTMSNSVWQLGEEWLIQRETHPDRNWGFDQLRHNAMFWSQDIPESDRLHPKLAYQAMKLRSWSQQELTTHDSWNGISINQAHILHFHGSRGSQAVIEIMKQLANYLGIKI
jgi:hypothetical protein